MTIRWPMFHVKRDAAGTTIAALYEKWSPRINLVAPSTPTDFWRRHVADSAQLLALAPDALHWVDLGIGGGFPGMVIAILLRGQPGAWVASGGEQPEESGFPPGGR